METYKEYHVSWEIELPALSPIDAAMSALNTLRDPDSRATVFRVKAIDDDNPFASSQTIDLTRIAEKNLEEE